MREIFKKILRPEKTLPWQRFSLLGFTLLLLLAMPLEGQGSAPDPEEEIDRVTFRDESVDQVLIFLERLTGRMLIRPEALPTPSITFDSRGPLKVEEAIEALETILRINGIGVSPMGDRFLKVVPLNRLMTEGVPIITESVQEMRPSGRIVSKMYQMNFLRPEEFVQKVSPLLTPNIGSIIVFEKANSLLITETVNNLQRLEALLEEFDRPRDQNLETRFFTIQNARASDVISRINALRQEPMQRILSSNTLIDSDERTNQVIVITDPRNMDYFENIIERMDVRSEPRTRNEVIFLKHAEASEVASLLSQLVSGQTAERDRVPETRNGRRNDQPERPTRPDETPETPSPEGNDGEPAEPQEPDTTLPEEIRDSAQEFVEEMSSEFSSLLTIIPDERSNAILVSGTRMDIEMIQQLIDKIDVLLAQVRIEVVIAEVTLSDRHSRGIDAISGIWDSEENNFEIDVDGRGFDFNVVRRPFAIEALLRTAQSDSNVNILSVPTIVTTHNREARIIVGQQRPVITASQTDGSVTTTVRSSIQFRDIGIQLSVLPRIAPDGMVEMEIEQRVESVVDNVTIDGNEQPIIGNREANSFVSVRDAETVVLGGLQSIEESDSGSRVAFLGSIPLVGNLFRGRTNEVNRTELLLFIRPHVIRNSEDADADASRMIERLSEPEALETFLQEGNFGLELGEDSDDDDANAPAPVRRRR
ncbi:MAG: hypothetical protein JJT75_10840 [Opitutales bacterium]|nr:hypothetical protein [Opitutales bacterium]MCH8539525.1 hypothetical protein [Opitutales bacterium]